MAATQTVVYALHLLFAGLWTGSVLYAAGTLPNVAGRVSVNVRDSMVGTLRTISRASAVVSC